MQAQGPLALLLAVLVAAAAALPRAGLAQAEESARKATMPFQRPPDRGTLTSTQRKAETFAAKLFGQAEAALAIRQYAAATQAYEDALEVLERAYGPEHPRLVEALSGIVFARTSWDHHGAQFGFGARSRLGLAVAAQERIVRIYGTAEGVDPGERVAALIDLGDVYLYTDDERAFGAYRGAWQLQAGFDSAETADGLFNAVGVIRLVLPENPLGHEAWELRVKYDVGPDGRATVSEVTGSAPAWLAEDVRDSYGKARFRPRFAGGEPVATRGVSSTHTYVATNPLSDSRD
jgi:hypothetical protein